MAQPQQQERPRGGQDARAAAQQQNLVTLKDMLQKMQKQLEAALPKFITADRMIRVAVTTVQRVPKLLTCHPVTVVGAIMQSAQLGLEPDNITGQAYLVPFWNTKNNRMECNLIPGYRGLMMLARRSKEIKAFDARVVKEGDLFDYEYGSGQFLKHKPAMGMKLDEKTGIYVPMVTKNGAEPETIAAYMIAFYSGAPTGRDFQFHVMARPELDKAKQFTKSRTQEGEITGTWIEHPDAMRTKTAIRRGSKLLPFSIELQMAVSLEERAIAGKSQNLGILAAESLGMSFDATDEDEPEGNGQSEPSDPELVKKLDGLFLALGFKQAERTVKMQEFRGRLPELADWLQAEQAKRAKPAGSGTSEPAATETKTADPGTKTSEPEQKAPNPETKGGKTHTSGGQGRFRI